MIRGDSCRLGQALAWVPFSMSFTGFDRVSLLSRHHYRHPRTATRFDEPVSPTFGSRGAAGREGGRPSESTRALYCPTVPEWTFPVQLVGQRAKFISTDAVAHRSA